VNRDVTRVEKPWGYELHWAKTERYVGKLIHVNDDWKRLRDTNMHPEAYTLRRVLKV